MKKPTLILFSTLLVSSFVLVNCQKAGVSRKAKTTPVAGANDAANKANRVAATESCLSETLTLQEQFEKTYRVYDSELKKSNSEEEQKNNEALLKASQELTNDVCRSLIEKLDKHKNKSCLKNKDTKTVQGSLFLDDYKPKCVAVAKDLKNWTGEDNPIAAEATQEEKVTAEHKKALTYLKKNFKLKSNAHLLLLKRNANFNKAIVEGEIVNQASIKRSLREGKLACSFISQDGLTVSDTEKFTFKFSSLDSDIEKLESDLLPEGIDQNVKSSVFLLEQVGSNTETEALFQFACLNLDNKKLSLEKIKKTFKSIIEETGNVVEADIDNTPASDDDDEVSEDAAAATSSANPATSEESPQPDPAAQAAAGTGPAATTNSPTNAANLSAPSGALAGLSAEALAGILENEEEESEDAPVANGQARPTTEQAAAPAEGEMNEEQAVAAFNALTPEQQESLKKDIAKSELESKLLELTKLIEEKQTLIKEQGTLLKNSIEKSAQERKSGQKVSDDAFKNNENLIKIIEKLQNELNALQVEALKLKEKIQNISIS